MSNWLKAVLFSAGILHADPSVVFLIDNSGSMISVDPAKYRFSVPLAVLDTLYARAPHSEAALAVFTRRLSFDNRDNPYYAPVFPGDTSQHDAFFPLTALDTVFPNGMKGIDSLKAMLASTGNGNLTHATCQPSSRANIGPLNDPLCKQPGFPPGAFDVRTGSDVTLAFEAGREAIKTARAPMADRYFVLLSDGNPAVLDDDRRGVADYLFVGGAGTPTTFTGFFLDEQQPATDSIRQMTENIRNNGYSTSNPRSAYFEVEASSGAQLGQLILNEVLPSGVRAGGKAAHGLLLTRAGEDISLYWAGRPFVAVFHDSRGKALRSVQSQGARAGFDVSGMEKGVYLVRAKSGRDEGVRRLVVD